MTDETIPIALAALEATVSGSIRRLEDQILSLKESITMAITTGDVTARQQALLLGQRLTSAELTIKENHAALEDAIKDNLKAATNLSQANRTEIENLKTKLEERSEKRTDRLANYALSVFAGLLISYIGFKFGIHP